MTGVVQAKTQDNRQQQYLLLSAPEGHLHEVCVGRGTLFFVLEGHLTAEKCESVPN